MNFVGRNVMENNERGIYKLVPMSLILPPLFAVAPLGPLGLFFGMLIAYQALITFVLPLAFTGLTAGYFIESVLIKKSKYATKRDHALVVVGYLAGFVAGLELVFYQSIFGPGSIRRLGALVGLATAGLVVSFVISRLGSRSNNRSRVLAVTLQPSDTLNYWSTAKIGNYRLRFLIIMALAGVAVVNFALPLLLYQ
jgi:hypothetical protein